MHIHAIVPMKYLDQAKSRLATLLVPLERRELALGMLQRVVTTLLHAPTCNGQRAIQTLSPTADSRPAYLLEVVWVVSSDRTVLALAQQLGARPLYDTTSDMNAALELARNTAMQAGAEALLIIPADVPLIVPETVGEFVQCVLDGDGAATNNSIGIAPDQERRGTNGLLLTLPTSLPFQFGPDSFTRYLETARSLGLTPHIYDTPALALDIDTPDDLMNYSMILMQKEKLR
jgi:2-phospho-L-lactate guanylyltransferase